MALVLIRPDDIEEEEEIPEEIPEWVKVSFLEFMVLLIPWGFIYNSCKSL